MLDYIRSNAQSFGVKVAFAIIILVFMLLGRRQPDRRRFQQCGGQGQR